MNVVRIDYGSCAKTVEVTDIAFSHFLQKGNLCVPKEAPFNKIFGDPDQGAEKCLRVYSETNSGERKLLTKLPEKRTADQVVPLLGPVPPHKLLTCAAVLVHCFDRNAWPDLEKAIENIVSVVEQCCVVVTVSVTDSDRYYKWKKQFEQKYQSHDQVYVAVVVCENRGMDIGAFFVACEYLQCSKTWPRPDFVFKLHSKRNKNVRQKMLFNLCNTRESVCQTIQTLQTDSKIGMFCNNVRTEGWQETKSNAHLYDLARLARIKLKAPFTFAAGTIFCARWSIIESLFNDLGPPRILVRLLNDSHTIDINWHRQWRMSAQSTDAQVRQHCALQHNVDGSLLSAKQLGDQERDFMIEHAFERFFGIYTAVQGFGIESCTSVLRNAQLETVKALRVGIATSNSKTNPSAGDLYTGREFGRALESSLGWHVMYLDQGSAWYETDDCDIVVAMLTNFRPSKMQNKSTKVIAWIRNWHNAWVKHEDFPLYDLVMVSSEAGARYVKKNSAIPAQNVFVLPLAVNGAKFEAKRDFAHRPLDYATAVSYWGSRRLLCDFDPQNVPHKGQLHGRGWHKFPKLRPIYSGFLEYSNLPSLYAASKIVVDDSNHVTTPWGALNSRIFDALASGALVVTNNVIGAEELFRDAKLPTYKSGRELEQLLCTLLLHGETANRTALIEKLQQEVLQKHTYVQRAVEFGRILVSTQKTQRREMFDKELETASKKDCFAVAIIIGYNEEDIIVAAIAHALQQGLHVYYVDDQSTDATREMVQLHYKNNENVGYTILPDQFRANKNSDKSWDLGCQLQFKESLAREKFAHYQWIVHMDCDEFFVCPWADSVVEGLRAVPQHCGIVNCTVRDHFPSEKDIAEWKLESKLNPMRNISQLVTVYRQRAEYYYQRFLRNSEHIKLNLGHRATTEPAKRYDKNMTMLHFPYRSAALAQHKLSQNRLPRISASDVEKKVGFHYQQDSKQLQLPVTGDVRLLNKTIANNRAAWKKYCTWYLQETVEKMPIFIISHNRLTVLKRCIASIRNCFDPRYYEIVVHDNVSTYQPLIDFLKEADFKVYWNDSNELDDVAKSVENYFLTTENKCQYYAVTDPDIEFDSEITRADTLLFYRHLLDNVPTITSAGPELRVDDIPDHYPLKEELLQRHRVGHANDKFMNVVWQSETVACAFRKLDTTFGVYRRSFRFKRLSDALLCHGRHNARHLDWYLDPNNMPEDDLLYMQNTSRWGHWSSTMLKPKLDAK